MILVVGMACPDVSTSLIHHLTFGPSLPIQMMTRASSSLPTLARTRMGLIVLLLGHLSFASAPSLRMSSQCGALMSLVEFMNTGPPPLMQAPLCIDLLLLIIGKVWIDPPLSVTDLAHCGLSISMRQFVRAGFMALVLGRFRLGFLMPPADCINMGSALLARCHGRLGLASFIAGILRAGQQLDQGSCLPIGGFARFDFPLSVFFSTRLGLFLSASDFLHLGSTLSARGFSRLDFAAFALDFLHLGLTLLLRSFSHPGVSVLALDVVSPESSLPREQH